jgi:ABC-type phosphate transport system substrate-binding protein
MEPLSFRRRQFLRILSSLGFGLSAVDALAAGEPIAVVMSSNSHQRGLSSDKLRRVFLALPTDDDDGHRFVPINLAQSSGVRERFDRNVLSMAPTEIARYWIDQRLRGNKPPRSASSLDLCRRAVQELPGAISYLPLSQVGTLKVLAIDGRVPTESAYALR